MRDGYGDDRVLGLTKRREKIRGDDVVFETFLKKENRESCVNRELLYEQLHLTFLFVYI